MSKIEQATKRGYEILGKHGVDWGIQIRNTRNTLAVTDHDTKTIELSKRFVLATTQDDFDGILSHELAHILVGPGRGHGKEFAEMCDKISAGAFSCDNYPIHIKSYKYLCDTHGVVEYNNAKKHLLCGKCMLEKGEFVDLKVVDNKIEVKDW